VLSSQLYADQRSGAVERDKERRDDAAKAEAQAKFLREHADDPVTVDYNLYRQTVGGTVTQQRKPAGSVKSLSSRSTLNGSAK
jgi:hypothetical protein